MKMLPLVLGSVMMWSATAQADIDYRCLQLCAGSGQNNSACMGQCALPKKQAETRGDSAQNSAREFQMMRKMNRNEILPPRAEMQVREEKDFVCIRECLRARMCAETCERGCVIDNPSGGKEGHVLGGQKPDDDKTHLDMKRLVPSKGEPEPKKPASTAPMPHVKGW